MAGVDPYAPCPCGSGQKFKWCCQKVEPVADKANRLYEGGQIDAALATLDEGLKKAPGNAWLTNRKSAILIREGRAEEARHVLEDLVAKSPAGADSWSLLVRCTLEVSGPKPAAEALQRALNNVPHEARPRLAIVAQLIGIVLSEVGVVPPATMHLRLAMGLRGGVSLAENQSLLSALQLTEGNPVHSPWLRNTYRLEPAPAGLDADRAERFQDASGMVDEGLWDAAAAGFELLAGDGVVEAEKNLGLCRLWMVDNEAAAAAFRRFVRGAGETTEAVDIEALRQVIDLPPDEDLVDLVQLIWTLRDRDILKAALDSSDRTDAEGPVPLDPDDAESVEVEGYTVLDRPKPDGAGSGSINDYPQMVGRVLVGQEIAVLEALDDGRLDGLSNWLTELAGPALPPSQPKTKEVDKLPRHVAALRVLVWMPEELSREQEIDLQQQVRRHVVEEVWTSTPMPYLDGRTPVEAAQGADAATRVALRAAAFQLELNAQLWRGGPDFGALRERLGIPPEPEVDPETVDLDAVHLARLHLVPAERLDDERLLRLYRRSQAGAMLEAMERSARAIVERPEILARRDVDRVAVYLDLANLSLVHGDESEAASWLRRGRESDPDARARAVQWDFADVRIRTRIDPPEAWVPELAIVLEQARADRNSGPVIVSNLIDMGLVRMVPNPDDPEEVLLDSRPLQALLAEYGPRITTAQGDLGVSASRGGIWTPGSEAGAGASTSGGIWTPGTGGASPPASGGQGGKSGLIIPGR